jgi:hypothetical protein
MAWIERVLAQVELLSLYVHVELQVNKIFPGDIRLSGRGARIRPSGSRDRDIGIF